MLPLVFGSNIGSLIVRATRPTHQERERSDRDSRSQFAGIGSHPVCDYRAAYAAGGEEAVKKIGGQTATLLLEHLIQQPMPILDKERERVRVGRGDDVGVANKEGQNQGAAVTAMRT